MTTVASIHGFRGVLADAVLIDRTSQWGNPFRVQARGVLAYVGSARQRVLLEHRLWWYSPEQAWLRHAARQELTGKTLLCHCSPLACHGDTIAGYLNLVVPFLNSLPVNQLTVRETP